MFTSQVAADAPEGFISGIASAPSTDLHGHRVLSGAFDDSIKQKGLNGAKGVKLLAFHDSQKWAGKISKLATVGENLLIEAQLDLELGYVKDLYIASKHNGGLNFSVGFKLQEFEFVDEDDMEKEDDPWLIVKRGDLFEVSVVTFPSCQDAEMTFVKRDPPDTLKEFEKALVAEGLCRSRNEAKRITQAVKSSSHLFLDKTTPVVGPVIEPVIMPVIEPAIDQHPRLDVNKLMAAADLAVKVKAMLGSR